MKSKQIIPDGFDPRIAKAFDFTIPELIANQNGYIVSRPIFIFGYSLEALTQRILRRPSGKVRKRKETLFHICGKIKIHKHLTLEHFGHGFFKSPTTRITYSLEFIEQEIRFPINEKQTKCLENGNVYRVYFRPHPHHREIITVERPAMGCGELADLI